MHTVRFVTAGANLSPVQVHLFAAARAAVGSSVVEAAPGTLAAICAELDTRYPDFASVRPRCSFLINEVAVHGEPSDTAVPAGARLDVLPPFAGG